MHKLVLFASGNGSNVQRIAEYFNTISGIIILRIYCNNPQAYVLKRAELLGIPSYLFNRSDLYQSNKVLDMLRVDQPDLIVLAGFLWLIPDNILKEFPAKIINIHPALLPKFGGKGMYGARVHEAVIQTGETESGITIHYVNENYDEGSIIFQAKCKVDTAETPDSLANKVHALEYLHYPKVIEKLLVDA